MSHFSSVQIPKAETVAIQLTAPNQVKLSGTITQKDPSNDLAGFFKALHTAALADKLTEVRADVSGLTFVNSSAIRLFVDWATWVKNERGQRYTLRFVTSRNVTWQKTSFMALMSLAKEVLAIEQVS
ncbi:MAG TPA: STAS domain-containing protein [Polyangiaceae bacterium]|nr:STAS domain-containing protein [Polyangiaceae bacterium]